MCVCVWASSWALWPKSNGRKHQFHHPVSKPPNSSPLLPLSSPLSAEMWLRSSSEHQWSKGFSVCMCVCVCLVTVWWSEQPGAAYCAPQFTDDVSRWMPPFTNTASPLAAALAALLLSFLLLCKKKNQLKQDKNKLEHKWFTWKKKKKQQEEGVWECVCVWGGDSSVGVHTFSIWTFTHEWNLLWETFTATQGRIYMFDFAALVLIV